MLFTGGVYSSGRLVISPGGDVDHIVAGFAYTEDDELVTDDTNAPQNFIKGIGIRNTGAVCTTTTTDDDDTWIEGVRVAADGKVVIEDDAPQAYASGNPVRMTGALATTTP